MNRIADLNAQEKRQAVERELRIQRGVEGVERGVGALHDVWRGSGASSAEA